MRVSYHHHDTSDAHSHEGAKRRKRRMNNRTLHTAAMSTLLLIQLVSFQEGVDAIPRINVLRGGSTATRVKRSTDYKKLDLPSSLTSDELTLTFDRYRIIEQPASAPVTPNVEATSTTASKKKKRSTPSSDVSDLACHFEQAVSALNQGKDDIHVGKLIVACERLERTMRKIGFTQSAKDIAGNISKIRNVYNRMPPSSDRNSMPAVLNYELNTGVITKGSKKLKEQSAAMGFLWLGRSINYQYDMFQHMLDKQETPYEAASHAYQARLKPHLSWPVQKVCQTAMTTLKPMKRESILAKIGGYNEECFGSEECELTEKDLRQVIASWKPMMDRWKQIFTELELGEI